MNYRFTAKVGVSIWKNLSNDVFAAGLEQRSVLAVNAESGEAKCFAPNGVS